MGIDSRPDTSSLKFQPHPMFRNGNDCAVTFFVLANELGKYGMFNWRVKKVVGWRVDGWMRRLA